MMTVIQIHTTMQTYINTVTYTGITHQPTNMNPYIRNMHEDDAAKRQDTQETTQYIKTGIHTNMQKHIPTTRHAYMRT